MKSSLVIQHPTAAPLWCTSLVFWSSSSFAFTSSRSRSISFWVSSLADSWRSWWTKEAKEAHGKHSANIVHIWHISCWNLYSWPELRSQIVNMQGTATDSKTFKDHITWQHMATCKWPNRTESEGLEVTILCRKLFFQLCQLCLARFTFLEGLRGRPCSVYYKW